MSAFFDEITTPTTFPAVNAPSIVIPFEPTELTIENVGVTNIEYSFDGVNVHGKISIPVVTNSLSKQKLESKIKKIWFRDGAGTGTVRVTANTI